MAFEDGLGIVLDTGSRFTKAGFIGEHFPRAVFPTVVGSYRQDGLLEGFPEVYCGHEAIKKRGLSNLSWPVSKGFIKNWEDIEKLWHHIFYKELKVPPEQTKVLYAVSPLVPKGEREKMAEIFFESFAISHLNLVKSPVLVLHATGRTTGVVYENGAGSSFISPVFEGFPLMHTGTPNALTGEALTDSLNNMLSTLGYSFTTPYERELVEDVKAKLCYVSSNYKDECSKFSASGENQVKFNLPDGQHILLGEERFNCPEVLFQPSIVNLKCPSIVDLICQSIDKCDLDIRKILYENIVTAGGSTKFPGLVHRLQVELTMRIVKRPQYIVKIDNPVNDTAAWVGGSVLGALHCLKGFWMTKQEYEDIGADRVNYKFF